MCWCFNIGQRERSWEGRVFSSYEFVFHPNTQNERLFRESFCSIRCLDLFRQRHAHALKHYRWISGPDIMGEYQSKNPWFFQ